MARALPICDFPENRRWNANGNKGGREREREREREKSAVIHRQFLGLEAAVMNARKECLPRLGAVKSGRQYGLISDHYQVPTMTTEQSQQVNSITIMYLKIFEEAQQRSVHWSATNVCGAPIMFQTAFLH